jgi:hypothetical protein
MSSSAAASAHPATVLFMFCVAPNCGTQCPPGRRRRWCHVLSSPLFCPRTTQRFAQPLTHHHHLHLHLLPPITPSPLPQAASSALCLSPAPRSLSRRSCTPSRPSLVSLSRRACRCVTVSHVNGFCGLFCHEGYTGNILIQDVLHLACHFPREIQVSSLAPYLQLV